MTIQQRETGTLIGSDKVEGTAVFGSDSQKIGSIERMMIDKFSGKVSYAVLSFGGFLGIGDDHYPLPWKSLKYDTQLGGYITGSRKPSSRARRNIKMTTPGIGPTPPAPARWTSTTVSPSDAGATWDKPPHGQLVLTSCEHNRTQVAQLPAIFSHEPPQIGLAKLRQQVHTLSIAGWGRDGRR